ncbi:V-type ATP synthase subunit E [Criibacterium bergeronii]|uniref:V-type proton ATPase subunit E n=1 Tax=Criibacterium bergeronii TaxID=1871336 RepID=A0A371IM94_9FIRM|nr:V-type ATP synthase subunit E [Criibacterium bergeronii]MBS6063568.1 V-type ATP synthase subunit E [Peptostreptococcaceae bacterium]RDY21597.1 hypothetical protein BBG48_004400 [Criibacterium bergeronii]
MTGLDKILDEIKLKGQQKAKKIDEEAQKLSSEILQKAELALAQQKEEFAKQNEKFEKLELEKGLSSALSQKNKEILKSKQELIVEVIEDAKKYISNLDKDKSNEFWGKIAAKYAHKEDGIIKLNSKIQDQDKAAFVDSLNKALEQNSKGKLTLSDDTIKSDTGFVMIYGDVEENCTLDAVMDNNQELLQDKLNEYLFG